MATIGFSTQWPKYMGGNPTNFVDKIWSSLESELLTPEAEWAEYRHKAAEKLSVKTSRELFPICEDTAPKHHTIRADVSNLWVPGRNMHMVVFNRTINRFQFAPIMEAKAIQKIEIKYAKDMNNVVNIFVDGVRLNAEQSIQLAKNDGFDSLSHFFKWFSQDFTGKIIHWTNLKY